MSKTWIIAVAALVAGACAAQTQGASAPPPPEAEASADASEAPALDVAAPGVEAPAEPAPVRASDEDITVPGTAPLPPPGGDPRTVAERREDRQRWDQCVSRAQNRAADDPTRPQLDTPEELCRQSLGMSERDAVPVGRR